MSVDEVSERLGVPTATILSWGRRHGLVLGHPISVSRRYSPHDLVALEQLRDRVATARTATAAAALVDARLSAVPTELCGALLGAAHQLDATTVVEVLDRSARLIGVPATIDDVVLPAFREIGNLWSRGACNIPQEQLATATIQGWLQTQSQRARPPAPTPVVVLSGGPSEQHTLGLAAFGVLLAHHGLACLDLGARTPATTLQAAVRNAEASAVVLTAQLTANRPATVAALRKLRDTSAALYYAGAGFRALSSRRGVPGTYLGGSLTNAAAHLATQLTP
jgi:MerR family transcriptional regulator, light-induced transcriptional regulator